jgi:hypothetical protein
MADGALVRSSAEARAAGHVTLKFSDGEIGAVTNDSPVQSTPPPQRPRRSDSKPGQSDLFE